MSIFNTIRGNKISGFTFMFDQKRNKNQMCFTEPDLSNS
jgi:hypothetical protein